MTSVKPNSSVICEEVFDDRSQPLLEEIYEYAVKIGINPEGEPHLLYLAKEGLMQAVPPDWKVCYDDKLQAHYYYNEHSKVTQWDHPFDAVYRDLVNQERLKNSTNTSNTATGVDLSEDVSQIDSGIRSLPGNEDSDLNMNEKLGQMNFEINTFEAKGKKVLFGDPVRMSRFEVVKTNPQIGLDMRFNSDPGPGPTSLWKHEKGGKKGFTLSGNGAMFLKSNTNKTNVIASNDSISRPIDIDRPKPQFVHDTLSPSVKGILRDSSLTDVRRRFDDGDTEDKKSVRFKFDEVKLGAGCSDEENPDGSAKKIDYSPDISDNSDDDDDPWDFMEDEDDQEKHVTEVKVIPAKHTLIHSLAKPLVAQIVTNETISREPNILTPSIDKAKVSEENPMDVDIAGTNILKKIKDRNMVRPLYEDTDSDSRGSSSVRSFIQKTTTNGESEINDFQEIAKDHEKKLQLFKEKLQSDLKAEEDRLEKEMQKVIQDKENLFRQKNEELISLRESTTNNDENFIVISENKLEEKKLEIDSRMKHSIEIYSKERELELKYQKDAESRKLEEAFEQEIETIKQKHDNQVQEVKEEYTTMLQTIKQSLEEEQNKDLDEFRCSIEKEFETKRKKVLEDHRLNVDILQRNHAEIVQDLERDLKSEEEILKKEHTASLSQMRDKLAHELEMERQRMREAGEDRLYEKIRCEKRLLEDKYKCLKEKYIRLKTDVKLSLERRNRRREQQAAHQSITTTAGSETERSASNKPSTGTSDPQSASASTPYTDHGIGKPPLTPKTPIVVVKEHIREKSAEHHHNRDRKVGIPSKYIKQLQVQYHEDTTSVSQSDTTISNNYTKGKYLPMAYPHSDNGNSDSEAFHRNQENNNNMRDRQRKKLFSRMKSASTSRLNTENFKADRPCTPVENLRRQLQKLEDLEDQFPDNTLDTTYHLRYPFSDISNDHAGTSSELEFFKHRIHLERDSVRRAKESLRTQRTNFRARQREIKQKHKTPNTRHTLDQLIQEEKELTEMEVNLHRTRALLGEKVIRLRHLEQSLQRIYDKEKPMDLLHVENKDDATLSDLSSHSSSGFSSTDFASDTNQVHLNRRRDMYQESSECIQNLEILNAEIREILDILSKQQSHGVSNPPQIVYPELNWALLSPGSQQANGGSPLLHAPQSIPTLADRLETYRQIAAGRVHTSVGGAILAANTIVSQSPRAVNYTTSLVERTRDLRNWLRQAKNEHDILSGAKIGATVETGSTQQANL